MKHFKLNRKFLPLKNPSYCALIVLYLFDKLGLLKLTEYKVNLHPELAWQLCHNKDDTAIGLFLGPLY